MTDRELMQMALDALDGAAEEVYSQNDDDEIGQARRALRARLAQPEPEPVAWMYTEVLMDDDRKITRNVMFRDYDSGVGIPLYTAPPQREWQGLTDEQIQQIEISASSKLSAIYLAEAQLKGKNAL